MMVKKIWGFLSGLALAVPATTLNASPGAEVPHKNSTFQDTVYKKTDSLSVPYRGDSAAAFRQGTNADPKESFRKNLFKDDNSQVSLQYLNPQVAGFVNVYRRNNSEMLDDIKSWGKPHFKLIEDIMGKHGLPGELKYLAVIESKLRPAARSRVGAVGYWQFMTETGRDFGLKINGKVDERKNLAKSTHAAAKYINYLYKLYGDWLLVIAAYNSGPGGVNQAIRKSGSRDFWKLQRYLPAESRGHVKRYIATHYYMEGEGGLTTLTKFEAKKLLQDSAEPIATSEAIVITNEPGQDTPAKKETTEIIVSKAISGRYSSALIVRELQLNVKDFNRLNPGFDKLIADNGKYQLRLPNEKMNEFLSRKDQILDFSMQELLNRGNTDNRQMK